MKVSVLVITYNHEKYIEEAINSILMQDVNFDLEIVIGDDYSTDRTREILLSFKEKHPNIIKLIFQPKNIGFRDNWVNTLNNCSGQYLALLEGDDFWCDTKKLQIQVDYMEANYELASCFHQVINRAETNSLEVIFPKSIDKSVYNQMDVLSNFFIPTLSLLIRRSKLECIPSEYFRMPNPDWLINYMCSENGGIGGISRVMGVYRIHNTGVWSSLSKISRNEKTIEGALIIDNYSSSRYRKLIVRRIRSMRFRICYWSLKEGKLYTLVRNILNYILGR